jgi:benzil reductase ((S)-benzoin forming)
MHKIAVVTGASSGIGYALSLELAGRGVVVVAIARNKEALEKLQEQSPESIHPLVADVTCETGLDAIISKINGQKINYLINCAGIVSPLGPLNDASDAELRKTMETNIIAPMLLTKKLIPFFNLSVDSRILNITSVSGKLALGGAGAYCISKAALNMWTSILQIELEQYGISVTTVIPGEVDTGMQGALRDAPQEAFPLATEFQEAKAKNTLIPPAICAHFLASLLLDVPKEQYSTKEWNIYTDYTANPLPAPLNKDKLATTR